MFDELEKYKSNGHFFFTGKDDLNIVCNAPKDGIGVYVVYALKGGRIELIYIGSSGKIMQNGDFKTGSGGLFDTLIHGKQFGDARKKTWKEQLISENIEALDIYWYETFDKKNRDLPNFVKGLLIQLFYDIHGSLPKWNLEY